ncbi:response regulator [Halalkalibacillus halophilus]|uniref:response regulator n=1 Tax=Halalkalibacillus halophilus TaxID=392827 RepID=UPI000422F964|nr:response regulator [Halalkalibacillus halophilus]
MKRKSVIVVDDEDGIRMLLTEVFQQANYVVESFSNGEHALQSASLAKADLFVVDFLLDDMRGDQFVQSLQNLVGKIPFIIVTGLSAHEVRTKSKVQIDHILEKPFSLDKLVDLAHELTTN